MLKNVNKLYRTIILIYHLKKICLNILLKRSLKKRTKNPEAKKDDPPNSLNRAKKQDSKVQEKDYGQSNEIIADNSGWKEENLDGF